ncbi:MAG: hypothetical protein D6753_12230 [Planctomycetota bacterium]|nr:MAG: hypothetical protein D6753_12230 [Planctomycetota bacterium]
MGEKGEAVKKARWLAVLLVACCATQAAAQRIGTGSAMGADLPAVGSVLPDITVYDQRGQVVSTATLRGSYTVLVFGCLT